MSYKNDKINMNKQINDRKNRLAFIIKITFIALFVSLLALLLMLVITMFFDNEKPVIVSATGSNRVVGYVGEKPTYRQYVVVTDNVDSEPVLDWNSNSVNINKPGEYKVIYQATDSSGNQSYFELFYIVKKDNGYTKTKLNSIVAKYADDFKNLSTEAQVNRIYGFVNKVIGWSGSGGTSNTPGANKNRDNWKNDWIEEAIRTLQMYEDDGAKGCEGDCYSYYSVSRAFFEYLGIKNIGLRRDTSLDAEHGTHFWSIVNVDGKWLYYDATQLKGKFSDGSSNACLINQAKLDSYQVSDGGKYNFYLISKTPECCDFSSAGTNSYPTIAK